MPKKKTTETQEEQSERFREAVRAAIDAGELNPTEADEAVERAFFMMRLEQEDKGDS